jgi:hypothetical protein
LVLTWQIGRIGGASFCFDGEWHLPRGRCPPSHPRKALPCDQPDQIVEFFRRIQPFQVVVEATSKYLWFVELVVPLAEKVVLAHPKKLRVIAKAPKREEETRDIIKTAPGVGFVTADVVISELGDVSRFPNANKICAYAGLVPKVRQTGGKKPKDLAITKEGSLRITNPIRSRRTAKIVRKSIVFSRDFSRSPSHVLQPTSCAQKAGERGAGPPLIFELTHTGMTTDELKSRVEAWQSVV